LLFLNWGGGEETLQKRPCKEEKKNLLLLHKAFFSFKHSLKERVFNSFYSKPGRGGEGSKI